ncbi:uncharacterized protein [Aegilops tauschii subsp. strangulata]|uniref:uncharacterized protein n=1 Tax=Aegilops tauschii subsp. strangulata TaxID=200361 RepID=UPI003CC8AD75
MIGLIWNIRGPGQPGKIQCLCDTIAKANPDFIGFQEAKKELISEGLLRAVDKHNQFTWHFLPALNTAGGILVGFRNDMFEVIGFTNKKFGVVSTIKTKNDKFVWQLVVVYGSAYPEFKVDFVAELHDIMESASYPVLVCGDFNLVRQQSDKSSGTINPHFAFLFNDWVNRWALLEISISNRSFTWSNNQNNPIFAVLDRVFTSVDWDMHFPLSTLIALPRVGSDHTPLVLDTGARKVNCPKMFRFEKWWLAQAGFSQLVQDVWTKNGDASSSIENWRCKTRALRKVIKGWSINIEAAMKKKKKSLHMEFDILDVKSEQNHLPPNEFERMNLIKKKLDDIWKRKRLPSGRDLETEKS